MVPLQITTAELKTSLRKSDSHIDDVELVDFFEKEEWVDKRSLDFRVWASDSEKTMTKEEIDSIRQKAIESVNKTGAELSG